MTIENNEDLLNIVNSAPIGICILDASTLVSEMVNNAFLEVAGKPYDAIYGKYYWDSFAEVAPYYEAALAGVVREGATYRADEVELMLIRQGKEEWVFVTFVYEPIKDKDGTVQKVAIWVLENTQQVKSRKVVQELNEELGNLNEELSVANEEQIAANEKLAAVNEKLATTNEELKIAQTTLQQINNNLTESESRFRRLVQEAPIAIFVLKGRDMVFETVNDLMCRMLGKSSNIIGKPYSEAVPELIGQPFLICWIGFMLPAKHIMVMKLKERWRWMANQPRDILTLFTRL